MYNWLRQCWLGGVSVPGDFIVAGAIRGGCAIGMRCVPQLLVSDVRMRMDVLTCVKFL